ncbi:Gti1/Pac2 family transcription factor, partial [Lecanoromycetidae sp. Uapishka_2]
MQTGKAPACVPTWRGHIETTKDALLIFEACFNGTLAHCFRRPHDRERNQLIVSGNVFVYEEATSGIKRWTDGIPWSPSRILTNFLIYRQLNSPFPPGEKKRATKRSQRPLKPGDPYPTTSPSSTPTTDESKPFPPESPNPNVKAEDADKDANRGLVGSLVDSYEFKENGLLKKTMTVTVQSVQHHLVSYYSLDDAKFNLKTPREDPALRDLQIRDTLLNQPKFKFPNLDDAGDGTYEQTEGLQNQYPSYYQNGYEAPRVYAPNPNVHHPTQVSSPIGPYPGVYAPSHPPSSGHGYAAIAPTTSSYSSTGSMQYPQHQPYTHLNQQPHYQAQSQQHYQAPHYPIQGHHPQEQQLQHSTYQAQPAANALPRPNAMVDYHMHQGESGMSHAYGPTGIKTEDGAPTNQTQHPQGWQVPYAQQWGNRQDGSYSSYRPQQP